MRVSVTLSDEAVDKLFSEYCRSLDNFSKCRKLRTKSKIINELIIEHLPEPSKHFDIANIGK